MPYIFFIKLKNEAPLATATPSKISRNGFVEQNANDYQEMQNIG